MTTDTVPQTGNELKAQRRALYLVCHKYGIRHIDVAAEAECSRTYVVQFFSGTRSPRAIALAVEKLILLAKTKKLARWRMAHAEQITRVPGADR